jgi:polyisoprenoid-binding protein YceI
LKSIATSGETTRTKISGFAPRMGGFLAAAALLLSWTFSANAETLRYKIDIDRSTVSASVVTPLASMRGRVVGTFQIVDGQVSLDPANPQGTAKVRILVDAGSYESDNPRRDRTVTAKSLQAEKYPTIAFESTSLVGVINNGPNQGSAIVNGLFTLHGVTNPLTVSAQGTLDADGTLTAEAEWTFNYEDYRVKVPKLMFGLLEAGNEATIHVHVIAHPETAETLPRARPR